MWCSGDLVGVNKTLLIPLSFVLLLLVGLIIYISSFDIFIDSVQPHYSLNETWKHMGNSITVTEIAAIDSYVSPDGTEYAPLPGEKLVTVRCEAVLVSGWEISLETYMDMSERCFLLTLPITEVNDDGEASQVLLFSVPPNPFPNYPWYFWLCMHIRCGEEREQDYFNLQL